MWQFFQDEQRMMFFAMRWCLGEMLREGGQTELLRALLCGRISLEGAVWRGIDHLGCSGLLGRFVEGGVQGRGLQRHWTCLTCGGRAHPSDCAPCVRHWALAASFCPSLLYGGLM